MRKENGRATCLGEAGELVDLANAILDHLLPVTKREFPLLEARRLQLPVRDHVSICIETRTPVVEPRPPDGVLPEETARPANDGARDLAGALNDATVEGGRPLTGIEQ